MPALLFPLLLVLSAPMASTTNAAAGTTSVRPQNPSVANTPSWVVGVLNGIGAPLTAQNVRALELWAGSEGTSARYNPLATTLGSQASGVTIAGSTDFNSVGVQNYPNESTGVNATVQTLKQSNFAQIRNSLVNAQDASNTVAAINASNWGSTIGPNTLPLGSLGPTGTTSTGAATSTANGCDSSKTAINIGPAHYLNQCQLKAIKGGALVVAGGIVMLVGVILIVGKSVPKPLSAIGGFIGGRETAKQPSATQFEGSPDRRGSASSHIPTRVVDPHDYEEF